MLSQLAEGVTFEGLNAEYDMTDEQIRAALRYGAWLSSQEAVRVRAG